MLHGNKTPEQHLLALALLPLRCVQVLMLVWDDQTNNYGLHSGVMATHDQETLNYFKGTAVTCVLCPRQGSDEDSYLQVNTDAWLAAWGHSQPRMTTPLTCHAAATCLVAV